MLKTLEQTRAEYSYECVNSIKDLDFASKFKTLVKKTPTLILTNGFGNTMAFLFSKGNPEHLALAYIIGRYLFEKNEYTKGIFNLSENIFNKDLEEIIGQLSNLKIEMQNSIFSKLVFTETDKYIVATEETLRLLNWLRRFVDAMIEDEKDKS